MSLDPRAPAVITQHVRWSDVDPVAIVRWDAYTKYIEAAEDHFFRETGAPIHESSRWGDFWLPRRKLEVEYHAPTRLGETLTLVAYLERLGTSSMTLRVDVLDDGATTLHAEARLVLVAIPQEPPIHPIPIPDGARAIFAPWVLEPAEARRRAAGLRARGAAAGG